MRITALILWGLALMVPAFMGSCTGGTDCCSQCDTMQLMLREYMQRDSMKSDLLRSYDEHLNSFGNIQDSIEAYEHQVDSLVRVIKAGGQKTSSQDAELQRYVQQIRTLISRNQDLAEELQAQGYRNASMDKLIKLMFANIEAKQAELKATQQEIADLRTKVSGLESRVEDLTSQNSALSETVSELNAAAAKVSGSVKVVQPKERKARKIQSLDIVYSLDVNDKARKGTVPVYFRILDGNGNVLEPSGDFDYKGKSIAYTLRSSVDYAGLAVRNTVTWRRTQTSLEPGTYTVDFYIDDHKGISDSFTLDK